MLSRQSVLILLVSCFLIAPAAGAEIVIMPAEVKLRGPHASHRLLVERVVAGESRGQVSGKVELGASPGGVVRVEDDGEGTLVVRPIANGRATLTVRAGDRSATATVVVEESDLDVEWSFRNHVQPVLTSAGCNSGACHGAAAGKNGFKLSLRGYDAIGDYLTLTRHALGRRIVPEDPGRSLILTKPTGVLQHKGGVRFEPGSLEYDVLAEWIATGTPAPRDGDPRIERLEVLPRESLLQAGAEQQLIVRAHFDDGRAEDVTSWAKFSATDGSVIQVDGAGRVRVMGHGEAAVTAWYLSRIVVATISVPFENEVDPSTFARAERRSFIDELVLAKLQRLKLPPSPPATDGEFIRRAFVDTIGVLPTSDEVREFLADRSPGKRDRLIDELLRRPEFVDYWTYRWSDLLLVNSANLSKPAMWAYYRWIRERVESNTPWDEFARGIVAATGSTLENGAASYFLLHKDPLDLAETTSVAFLGMSINCARCHDHPLEKWTNEQYYRMANLFARVRTKDAPGAGNAVIFPVPEGDVIQPLTGHAHPPTPLDGEPMPIDDPADRRLHLAKWLTSPDNPYFARAIANRVWANFMGVGLVEPVDDLRMTNPSSNETLLRALAHHLVEKRWDLKALMRTILQSATYQRSSAPTPENRGDRRFYSRTLPRRMSAEVMLDAISQVTGAPTSFPGYPSGWRALQLPDSNVESYFLASFGRPDRVITCACERTDEPSMAQVLHIANGDTLNAKLRAGDNRIGRLLAAGKTNAEIVDDVYLGALSRYPTDSERRRILELLDAAPADGRREAIEDLYWSVLSSREFLFNH